MPESQHLEYKRHWKNDLPKWLCASANAEACGKEGYPAPRWTLEPGGVWVTFSCPAQETGQVTPQVEQLLLALQGDTTREALMTQLGLRDREHFRTRYLVPALAAGLIGMTIPDKPNSRLQKYPVTQAGRRLQATRTFTAQGSSKP